MARFVLLLTLLFAATAAPAWARAAPAATAPNLVVLISIDQMRADYVDQYGDQWSKGLKRLFTRGAVFPNARYPYLNTVTCAGHSTIGTGAFPHRHGMVLNAWWDPVQRKPVECTADAEAPTIFYGAAQESPGQSARSLKVPTLAETLREAMKPLPRVVSFAGKARSAIGLVGKGADLVVWYEGDGAWGTSRAYASGTSPLVERVLDKLVPQKLIARAWDRVLPAARYRFADEAATERLAVPWWTSRFPHPLRAPGPEPQDPRGVPLPPLAAWERSPLPDEVVLALALEALDEMALGQGMSTDFLALGLSSLDVVGHAFGPRSHEVQDTLVRLDRLLGRLLQVLDRKVGRGRYVLALTADHGVATIPEQLAGEGADAGRLPLTELREQLQQAIAREIGPGTHLATILYTDVYLMPGVLEKLKGKPGALERILNIVRATRGVAAAFSTDQLRDLASATDPVLRAAALSHFPGRSGQLVLVPKRNWLTSSAGTTHGSLSDYDQHVPVLLYGAGVRPGKYHRAVTPADVAPTLAALLGLDMPRAEGRPLAEAVTLP